MKKSGFTLAELMITLGIIAVAAVIAAPAISNVMPQKDKMKVIKYAVMIDDANNELLANKEFYHSTKYTGIISYNYSNQLSSNFDRDRVGEDNCIGLACTDLPTDKTHEASERNNYRGENKYKTLLSEKLGLKDGKHADGSVWTFDTEYTAGNEAAGIKPDINVQISIDIDGANNGRNCHYPLSSMDNTVCAKPDTFLFTVDKNGSVKGDDPLTRAYLANPLNMHDKKKDAGAAVQELFNYSQPPRR